MLESIVYFSVQRRALIWVLLVLQLFAGLIAARYLPIDAMPDVSSVQVSVLTTARGMSATEMERAVTRPIENVLNGIPNGVELRSVSRNGLSAVTVVFSDATDVWFARQLVAERLRSVEAELPPSAEKPELAPVSTGLGEIYQFVVKSEVHTPMQLRTLLDWEIVPKLRTVPGVVEVNTMGGDLKQYQVLIDRGQLSGRHCTVNDVVEALRAANLNVGGGYVERGAESFTIRGQGLLRDSAEIEEVVVKKGEGDSPILVRHLAKVQIGSALRHGVITYQGKGEAVTGIVMMLLGSNSNDVVRAVGSKITDIQKELPPGVMIETVYDRADFVGRTISTVFRNLLEGVIIVTIVLTLFLGSLRGALAVVLGIPCSMAVAIFGMHLFHVTGDLMSLGAIDFGFLVDGPIVMLEAILAATIGKKLSQSERISFYAKKMQAVARPVVFSVGIILLVYIPLLSLEGIEGKMFRPMAITMACALFGAIQYSLLFFPAVTATLVPPAKDHGPRWLVWLVHQYEKRATGIVRDKLLWGGASVALFFSVSWLFIQSGAEFVPRIFEGDAMVTIRRAPSISLSEARRLDLETEQVLATFPEITNSLGMTGRAEVAIDPVGNDNTDILIRLKPVEKWTTAHDFDSLSEAIKQRVESKVVGTFVSVSQPIEDKTNELISGSRADVAIQIYGQELEVLADLADKIGTRVSRIRGAGDVRVERILGQPQISAVALRPAMARHGIRVDQAFLTLAAAREGVTVGNIYEADRRFELRVLAQPAQPTAEALGDLFIETIRGTSIPLREVMSLDEGDGPSGIRRLQRERVVRVDVNLRGRDLVSFVSEAKGVLEKEFPMAAGYRIEWGGQFENFERAQKRLALVVPAVVLIIFGMLYWMFQNARFAAAVFIMVPLSIAGGMVGLLIRGMPFSLSAAVGFIALGGIAVLNGVVIASEVRHRLIEGESVASAIPHGVTSVVRAVLTTATVAALGFLPMAVAASAGAEVQRPLATVVISGMLIGTILTLTVFPGVLSAMLKGYEPTGDMSESE